MIRYYIYNLSLIPASSYELMLWCQDNLNDWLADTAGLNLILSETDASYFTLITGAEYQCYVDIEIGK